MSEKDILDGIVENIISQTSLENQIESDAQNILDQKSNEQETKRLERSLNKLTQLKKKRELFQRRLNNANRISVKNKLRKTIDTLNKDEISPLLQDIKDIKSRIKVIKPLKENDHYKNNKIPNVQSDRQQGESETDYLIRVGKVTAFGNKSNFVLTNDEEGDTTDNYCEQRELGGEKQANSTEVSRKRKASHNIYDSDLELQEMLPENVLIKGKKSKRQSRENQTTDISINEEVSDNKPIDKGRPEELSGSEFDEEEFESELEEEEVIYEGSEAEEEAASIKVKASNFVDDGDEYSYQKRLKSWIKNRSKDRKIDKHPELPEWLKTHPDFKDAKLSNDLKIPGEIFSNLFNYQKTCVQWLWELRQQKCGGILSDEMGLGKTIQIIAFLASLHHSNKLDKPVLIVCPATVMKQWVSEIHKWWPPFRAIILHSIGAGFDAKSGKEAMNDEKLEEMLVNSENFTYEDYIDQNKVKNAISNKTEACKLIDKVVECGHILVTTYVGLKINSDRLLKVNWSYVILDEGHKIRNPNSDISLTCKRVKCRNRIILSGTPIQNNLIELWSLFDFIYPGKLGTLPIFQQQFAHPINMGGYANATNLQVQTGYKCAVLLKDLITPYLLRRVKSDVAKDLPKKNEMVLFCKLTKYQRNKYMDFLNSDELTKIKGGKIKVLYGIDVLRKICNHPDLLISKDFSYKRPADYGSASRSGKMQVVKQLLKVWHENGHKTLLFTQSRQMLNIFQDFIEKRDPDLSGNLKVLRMDGTTNIGARQALVDKFNNENYDVFLLTTKVGGLGINLTGADRIIIYDPDWNPSTDLQARERAWRIGQKRDVTIYRLMIAGSIEEKIYHRQIFKQFLSNKILKDPNQKRFFKTNELQDLFTLGGSRGYNEELNEQISTLTEKNNNKSGGNNDDDLNAVSSMSGVSKLEGFYDSKEHDEIDKTEDDRLMKGLFGIESAVSHNNLVDSHYKPSDDIITREAVRSAARAAEELKKSRNITKQYKIGTPTWTGKFGVAGKAKKNKKLSITNISKSKNISTKMLNGGGNGSSAILDTIKKLNNTDNPSPTIPSNAQIDAKLTKDVEDLSKFRDFLRNKPNKFATSSEIINGTGFKLITKEDTLRLRAFLKQIATFDKLYKGWKLKEEK
ncbi:related to DNA repair and recombination protein RAD26 [Saccharomycodes ludwigii]|uniref:DNA helicase n=1 Tax=Saccharomycodes ludwigii TaxID=36035 RepID=A0A376B136_9ASCO|nr:related to DNA repair and recombination protein RAD26 [Saccharomycodes ludwigii]